MAVRSVRLFADDTAESERRVLSEDAIARKRALAEALRAQSVNAGQIESPWEGLAQMSNAVFGALGERKAESDAERRQQALASAMGGLGTGGPIDPAKLQILMELDPELAFQVQQQERQAAQARADLAAAQARDDAIRREGYGREDAATAAANAREDANKRQTTTTDEEETAAGLDPSGVWTKDAYGNWTEVRAPIDPADPVEAQNTGPGDIGRNPITGEIIYANPAKPPDPPSLSDEEKEYERYVRGETEAGRTPMPFLEYQTAVRQASRAQTNVNIGQGEVGTIPPGYELFTDPETNARQFRQIPGGPAAIEAEEGAEAAANAEAGKAQQNNLVVQDIDRALGIIERSGTTLTTGLGGNILANLPGTPARDLRGLLDTIKANTGFQQLQAMRDASPTGGALGQVTERELALLQAVMGNLEQSQSPAQLRQNLQRVRQIVSDIVDGPGASPAPPQPAAQTAPPPQPQTAPQSAAPTPLDQRFGDAFGVSPDAPPAQDGLVAPGLYDKPHPDANEAQIRAWPTMLGNQRQAIWTRLEENRLLRGGGAAQPRQGGAANPVQAQPPSGGGWIDLGGGVRMRAR